MIFRLFRHPSRKVIALISALLWLIVISALHFILNSERPSRSTEVLMGYMPVVTNLSAPLVDAASTGGAVHFQAIKFASFAEMAEAFRSGHIQVAFIIAPLAIALHQQGVPLKVVYIGNRHESTLVVKKDLPCESLGDMVGKTIAVPLRYSGHLLALRRYLREHGLDPQAIRTVEIPPPDMPSALAANGIDGYFVGEPFGSKAIQSGIGRKLVQVEDIWPKFICNLVIVRDDLVKSHPEWVQTLVSASVRAGFYARDHLEETETLLCRYWGQDPRVISFTFSNPPGRFRFDLYVPLRGEMDEIAREMQLAGLLDGRFDPGEMVDDHFARAVSLKPVDSLDMIMVK